MQHIAWNSKSFWEVIEVKSDMQQFQIFIRPFVWSSLTHNTSTQILVCSLFPSHVSWNANISCSVSSKVRMTNMLVFIQGFFKLVSRRSNPYKHPRGGRWLLYDHLPGGVSLTRRPRKYGPALCFTSQISCNAKISCHCCYPKREYTCVLDSASFIEILATINLY